MKKPRDLIIGRALTPRQHQILRLIGYNETVANIAKRLRIGEGTVHTYIHQLPVTLRAPTMRAVREIAHAWVCGELRILANISPTSTPRFPRRGVKRVN